MIRLADIFLATTVLLISMPVLVGIAIVIWWHEGRPIFFYQNRVGKDLEIFKIIKFRTMYSNSDGLGEGANHGSDYKTKQKARAAFKTTVPGDPRITPVGRVLRAYHFDELPQLFNILKGEMSWVGVRPDTPAQEVDYEPEYWKARHSLRPGITGPAQIASNVVGLDERTRLEIKWLSRPTLTQYFSTIIRTLRKVVIGSSF